MNERILIIFMIIIAMASSNSDAGNQALAFGDVSDLTVESRLLAVVLMFTLLVAISLLISFYIEIAGKPTEKNMVTGILLVLACSATFTTSNALQKFGHHSCAPWQFLIYRGAFQILSMMLFRCWSFVEYCQKQMRNKSNMNCPTKSLPKEEKTSERIKECLKWYLFGPNIGGARIRVVLQGLCGAAILFGIFTSLHLIPAAEATAIFFMVPIFSFVFSSFMLKEPYTILRVVISLIVIVGVGLVTRPRPIFDLIGDTDDYFDDIDFGYLNNSSDPHQLVSSLSFNTWLNRSKHDSIKSEEDVHTEMVVFGYISALIVPASVSMISILSRQLATISTETLAIPLLMMWQGVGCILIGVISYAAFNDPEADEDVGLLWWSHAIGVIIFGMMGNIFVTLGTKFITPSMMNVIRCIEVVFMCFIQLELSESIHDKVFYIEYGAGIFALFLAGGLLCFESLINGLLFNRCFQKP